MNKAKWKFQLMQLWDDFSFWTSALFAIGGTAIILIPILQMPPHNARITFNLQQMIFISIGLILLANSILWMVLEGKMRNWLNNRRCFGRYVGEPKEEKSLE